MKIDIRSDKSLYVEIDGYTVYIDTSLADGPFMSIHKGEWYCGGPVKAWAYDFTQKNQPCATEASQ